MNLMTYIKHGENIMYKTNFVQDFFNSALFSNDMTSSFAKIYLKKDKNIEIDVLTQKLEKVKQALSELVNMFFSDLEDFEIVERLNEYYLKQLKEAQQALKELE